MDTRGQLRKKGWLFTLAWIPIERMPKITFAIS